MTTTLNAPLVAHDSEVVCGSGHALRVITNGHTAYAACVGGTDAEQFVRDAEHLRLICGQRTRSGEPCEHEVSVDLTTEDWTGDPSALALLADHGAVVSR